MIPSTTIGSADRPIELDTSTAHARPRRPMFRSVMLFSGLKCCDSKFPPFTSQLSPRLASASTRACVTFPGVPLPLVTAFSRALFAAPCDGVAEPGDCARITPQTTTPPATMPINNALIAGLPSVRRTARVVSEALVYISLSVMPTDTNRAVPVSRSVDLAGAVAAATERFGAANPKNLAQHAEATAVMPGGNTRTVLYHDPLPSRHRPRRGLPALGSRRPRVRRHARRVHGRQLRPH